jgi:uncharacterized protein YkwD
MMKILLSLVSLVACLIVGACTPGRTVSAQARAEQNQQVYEIYRQYMAATNQERQQAGLPPLTVRSYEEFRRAPGTD